MLWQYVIHLTIGIFCLEAIRLNDDRREDDYLWFILGGGVQQAIMTIGIDTKGALGMQIHFILIMCKLQERQIQIERERDRASVSIAHVKITYTPHAVSVLLLLRQAFNLISFNYYVIYWRSIF